jgi:nitrate/nitrite transporter NarK
VWAITQTLAGPLAAGKWTGVQNAIGNLGGVVSPMLTGWIVAETGSFVLAFAAASLVLLCGAASYLSLVGEIRTLVWRKQPLERVVEA